MHPRRRVVLDPHGEVLSGTTALRSDLTSPRDMQRLSDASKKLHLLIDACAFDAQSCIAFGAGNESHGYALTGHAKEVAAAVAEISSTMPSMFDSRAALASAWNNARFWIEARQRRERMAAQIAAGDWSLLGIRVPMELLSDLLSESPVRINGSSLYYDPEHDITWYLNAYGVESVWCQRPDQESLERFIQAALLGEQFGLVPEGTEAI